MSPPGIKGKKAIHLVAKTLFALGIDVRVVAGMFFLVNNSLKRKITICHESLFEKRLREICNENKHEMSRGNCRKVADEILDLFCYDPNRKMNMFIMNNQANIVVFLTLVSIAVSILAPMISKLL